MVNDLISVKLARKNSVKLARKNSVKLAEKEEHILLLIVISGKNEREL